MDPAVFMTLESGYVEVLTPAPPPLPFMQTVVTSLLGPFLNLMEPEAGV